MIIFFIYLTSVFIVTLGFGLLVKKLLVKEGLINSLGLGDTGLLGFYLILLLSLLFHFFIPLTYYVTGLFFTFGIIFFFYFKNTFKIYFPKKYLILVIVVILPGLFSIKGHPDLEWYHLPYLNYLKDFKIIFGIANVNDFLGYSQSWNDIAGALRLPIVDAKGINIIPSVFAIYFIFSLIELLVRSKNTSIKIFIYLILIFSISKYNRLNEYGGHVPPILLGFLINIYFYKLILESHSMSKEIFSKIFIFASFVFLLRINYIFIFPVILFTLIKYKYLLLDFILNKKILILLFFIPFLYFAKNTIHTGCLMYPVDYSCFSKEKMAWSVGISYTKERYDGTKASVRGWNDYVLLEGNIDDRVDYLIPLKNNQILSQRDYINQKKFFWVKYWAQSGDAIKILNNFILVFFCMLVIFFTGRFQNQLIDKKNEFNKFITLFTVFFLQLILWFFLTPQTIYGGDVATVVFIAFLSSFFLKNLILNNARTKIAIFSLFLLSISYFEIKNIKRTYDEYFKNSMNSKIFPWIEINNNKLGNEYYQILVDGNILNVQKKIKGRKVGLPDPCGNTPMICLPEDRIQCVEGIYKKYSYLFIKGNELLCIEHIKERLFY